MQFLIIMCNYNSTKYFKCFIRRWQMSVLESMKPGYTHMRKRLSVIQSMPKIFKWADTKGQLNFISPINLPHIKCSHFLILS